ncbi:peptidase M10 [Sorangium cellulosum]|uniref:Peptidase M10 n=1 Tax=Sorangium cellulosum TaxID=56 RepID=A0A2L0EZ25_SORCE|nr:matrixin family metalloprotease [Sorangium cellulosum]AUX44479.1 peptidase M10 [Sorangium cellulosum]
MTKGATAVLARAAALAQRTSPAAGAARRPPALAALLAALALLAGSREAGAWSPLDFEVVPRWGELPVRYHINQKTIPAEVSGFAVAGIEAGFAAWSSPPCTAWATRLLGDTDDTYDFDDGKNVFHWISDGWPAALGDADVILAITMPVWDPDDVIDDADTVFNNVGFCWNDGGDGGCLDVQSLATHEQGHFLGLGHTNVRGATMVVSYPGGVSPRSLEDDDLDGVCALYPASGEPIASATAGAGGGAGGAGAGADEAPAGGAGGDAEDDAGCACAAAGRLPDAGGALLGPALAALAALPWRRRRRRRAAAGSTREGALYNPAQSGQTCRHARAEPCSVRRGGRACPPLP